MSAKTCECFIKLYNSGTYSKHTRSSTRGKDYEYDLGDSYLEDDIVFFFAMHLW